MLAHTIEPELKLALPNVITVVRELPADLETPVSVYLKLASRGASFLLESVTGGEQVARYSFIGAGLERAYILRGRRLERRSPSGVFIHSIPEGRDPLNLLRSELSRVRLAPVPGLPRFAGGLVGYLGYDTIPCFEPRVPLAKRTIRSAETGNLPDAVFLLADTLVAFDHAFGRMLLIANVRLNEGETVDRLSAHTRATGERRLDALEERLAHPVPAPVPEMRRRRSQLVSNTGHGAYVRSVLKAKEYIAAGEIFQVVLSQRFSRQTSASPFDIYRTLRRLNPSPYMFYFDFGDLSGEQPLRMIGASPEVHVRLEGRRATVRPIAGTRRRGLTPGEDQTLAEDLLADPKERAEHVMLVDLARNDLGRVCEYGSVRVTELMGVERYSHVMHIVSHVEGRLRPELDGFDLLRATFPAGTVSGAPKIRAMQIISELEQDNRGPYAGAVGYFSYDGSLDTCIAIRTLVMQGQRVDIQAGAGIVADSDAQREYEETLNKARALELAVELAEK
jgi:anthranilate synthase component 1